MDRRGWVVRALLTLLALLLLGATAPSAKGPSFACKGQLSASERAICSDPELSAWDRGMAKVWRVFDNGNELTQDRQRKWLEHRNGCQGDRSCLLDAYRSWPGFVEREPNIGFGQLNYRKGTGPDEATLEVLPIYDGWIYFSVSAIHIQSLPGGIHNYEAWGLLKLKNGKAIYDEEPGTDYTCRFRIKQVRRGWIVEEFGETTQCGGLNVTMSGDYRPVGNRLRM